MEFLFLAGRIRALQSKLLTEAQIERMVGAASAEDAFRVFSELQYAEYMSAETSIGDFEEIIDQGLRETKELIISGTDNAIEFDVIWKQFDVNNFKRALKEKLVDAKTEIADFSADNGYEPMGSISKEVLENAVFNHVFTANIPTEISELVLQIDEIFANDQDFQKIDFMFDNALFVYLKRLAKEQKSEFLQKMVVWQIDRANLKTMLRVKNLEQELTDDLYLTGGNLSLETFKTEVNIDSFTNFLFDNDFMHLALKLKGQTFDSAQDMLLELERLIEAETTEFAIESDEEALGSVVIPLVYFLKRVKNARVLKFVMYAKIYGLDPERIYSTIKHF